MLKHLPKSPIRHRFILLLPPPFQPSLSLLPPLMDPCSFIHLSIHSLALKLPSATAAVPCFAKLKLIKLPNFPTQTALLPIAAVSTSPESYTSAPGFHLDPETLRSLSRKPVLTLKISVFSGRGIAGNCGVTGGSKLLGVVMVCVDLRQAETRACVYENGWVKLEGQSMVRLHLVVRSEPDPRFVFQFGGPPECSPVVFQIQEDIRQPVFSCKFTADRNNRSRSFNRGWLRTFSGERDRRVGRDRKGWMIIVHDLSGRAVAAASMTTPFVASPGSDRVSRSNPGTWLILRPDGASTSSWKPWGRLDAWRERGPVDGLGYKFELVTNTGLNSGIPIAEGTMSVKKGGKFHIDRSRSDSVLSLLFRGFVMESSVEGEGKVSKPVVQVGAQHVTCMADAAVFVALSAAIDLCMDACQLFSHKLRKEFCNEEHELMFP